MTAFLNYFKLFILVSLFVCGFDNYFFSFVSRCVCTAFAFFISFFAAVAFVAVAAAAFVFVTEEVVVIVVSAVAAGAHIFLVLLNEKIYGSADSSQ